MGGDYQVFAEYRERHPDSSATYCPPGGPGGNSTITVAGVLDSETSPDFYEGAALALARISPGSTLELRLEGVRFISSTGVGTLTRLLAEAEGAGVSVRVAGMSPACADVFSVLGLLRYFGIPEEGARPSP